ncbi:MAG: SDR family oxidoreductase [Pseudomonadales bacterium]|nr:SDR family oxidoreductase [Pseudomonadales bacterium]
MFVKNKVIVVTGAASGIGLALAERFINEGAEAVFIADINEQKLNSVAEKIGAIPIVTDVSNEDQVKNLITTAEAHNGHIDLLCCNAGILLEGGTEVANEVWQKMWEINVFAHVLAARAALPNMIKRGEGYILNTVSAAGLLSQIGSSPYSVTKHAAVGFAESLAIEHGDQGIKVSILCPQGVDTPMLQAMDDSADVASRDGVIQPSELCDAVIKGLESEGFLILPHPEVETYLQRKTNDYDRWLSGMRRLKSKVSG